MSRSWRLRWRLVGSVVWGRWELPGLWERQVWLGQPERSVPLGLRASLVLQALSARAEGQVRLGLRVRLVQLELRVSWDHRELREARDRLV